MFRFLIRDVLWLTVVVAMGVGWWLDRLSASQERVAAEMERARAAERQAAAAFRESTLQTQVDFLNAIVGKQERAGNLLHYLPDPDGL